VSAAPAASEVTVPLDSLFLLLASLLATVRSGALSGRRRL